MPGENISPIPLEGQSMRDVVHHIMNVGATQAAADFDIIKLRKKVTEAEDGPMYGNDPTRLWNRGLMVSLVHHWQRTVAEKSFSENPKIRNLSESDRQRRVLASNRVVDERFIQEADHASNIILNELSHGTDEFSTAANELPPSDATKQLFQEYETERSYRSHRLLPKDPRALPIAELIKQGAGTTLSEAIGLLKVHLHKHREEGNNLTATEAADLLLKAGGSHVSPLLKISSQKFDSVRVKTREIELFGGNDLESSLRGQKPTDNFYPDAFERDNQGRVFPINPNGTRVNLHLPTERRFRDRDGCPAGYPTSMTNEFYPGFEPSNGGPALNLYSKFAEVIRYLKI